MVRIHQVMGWGGRKARDREGGERQQPVSEAGSLLPPPPRHVSSPASLQPSSRKVRRECLKALPQGRQVIINSSKLPPPASSSPERRQEAREEKTDPRGKRRGNRMENKEGRKARKECLSRPIGNNNVNGQMGLGMVKGKLPCHCHKYTCHTNTQVGPCQWEGCQVAMGWAVFQLSCFVRNVFCHEFPGDSYRWHDAFMI